MKKVTTGFWEKAGLFNFPCQDRKSKLLEGRQNSAIALSRVWWGSNIQIWYSFWLPHLTGFWSLSIFPLLGSSPYTISLSGYFQFVRLTMQASPIWSGLVSGPFSFTLKIRSKWSVYFISRVNVHCERVRHLGAAAKTFHFLKKLNYNIHENI